MKQRLGTRLFSASVSLVAVAAWFVASNHCAIANVAPKPAAPGAADHSHCGGAEGAPAKEDEGGDCDGSKCCKSLSVPTLAFAKSAVSYDGLLFVAKDYFGSDFGSLGTNHDEPICELDTGPPATRSFAESVLQRSILAHAPPSLV